MEKIKARRGMTRLAVIVAIAAVVVIAVVAAVMFWPEAEADPDEEYSSVPVTSSPEPGESANPLDETIELVRGNTPGNIANLGLIAQDEEWIYYSNAADDDKLYKMKHDGFDQKKVCDEESVAYINVADNWIYFKGKMGNICKIRTNGKDFQRIGEQTAAFLTLINDWLYYKNTDFYPDVREGVMNTIWKIKTDGTDATLLCLDSVINMTVSNGWIYYSIKDSDNTENNGLYRIDIYGSNKEKIFNYNATLVIEKEWGYYSDKMDGNKLYRMKTDGTGKELICDDYPAQINVSGDWIYYSNLNDGWGLYRIRTDGTGREKLNDTYCYCISIAGEWVFYWTNSYNDVTYFFKGEETYYINHDGLDIRKLS